MVQPGRELLAWLVQVSPSNVARTMPLSLLIHVQFVSLHRLGRGSAVGSWFAQISLLGLPVFPGVWNGDLTIVLFSLPGVFSTFQRSFEAAAAVAVRFFTRSAQTAWRRSWFRRRSGAWDNSTSVHRSWLHLPLVAPRVPKETFERRIGPMSGQKRGSIGFKMRVKGTVSVDRRGGWFVPFGRCENILPWVEGRRIGRRWEAKRSSKRRCGM